MFYICCCNDSFLLEFTTDLSTHLFIVLFYKTSCFLLLYCKSCCLKKRDAKMTKIQLFFNKIYPDLENRFRENCSKVSVGQHRFTDQKKKLYSQSAFSSMQQMSQLAVIFNFMLWVKGSFRLVHLMASFQFLQDTKVCCHLVFSSP